MEQSTFTQTPRAATNRQRIKIAPVWHKKFGVEPFEPLQWVFLDMF